jgi:hypothetical protein
MSVSENSEIKFYNLDIKYVNKWYK